jgi:hypothetical protein
VRLPKLELVFGVVIDELAGGIVLLDEVDLVAVRVAHVQLVGRRGQHLLLVDELFLLDYIVQLITQLRLVVLASQFGKVVYKALST